MNCKPGELAVVIRDYKNLHIGRIITVVRYEKHPYGRLDAWVTDPVLIDPDGCLFMPTDNGVRPIRPDETHEESTEAMRLLTQLPKKEKV